MSLKISHTFLLLIGCTALLGGCQGKDGNPGPAGVTGPQGPAGPTPTGSIVGYVDTFDEFGRYQNKSGVTVTLENETPAVSATTDANGRYELTNVKSGTYNIAFNKVGYGTGKIQGYPFFGGDQAAFLRVQALGRISATSVTNLALGPIQAPNGQNIYDYTVPVSLRLTNPSLPVGSSMLLARVFVGASPTVTAATGVDLGRIDGSTNTDILTRSSLNAAGFTTGSTAYAVAYGAPLMPPSWGDMGYINPTTGRFLYTALNPTPLQAVSFVVP